MSLSVTMPAQQKPARALARWTWVSWVKIVVFLACLVPAIALVVAVVTGGAGPNPIEYITHVTGEWALRFLLLSLTMTPLRWITKSLVPTKFRRMIGLYAFFYVALHFTVYMVLDQQLDVAAIVDDLFKRTYIIAGFVSLVILIPLALTSTKAMMRRLGKRWKSMHRWVYVASVAAVLHYVWLAKGDQIEPLVYAAVLAVLLGARIWRTYRVKRG